MLLFQVSASREDYGVVMKTLSGNLAEGAPPGSTEVAAEKKPTTSADKKKDNENVEVKVEANIESTGSVEASNRTKMEFLFEIESIAAQLYDGSSNLVRRWFLWA